MSVEEGMTKLRASLKRRGAEGIRGLARHFKICDSNGNGTLDADEFTKCCRLNNLGLTTSDISLLPHGADAARIRPCRPDRD